MKNIILMSSIVILLIFLTGNFCHAENIEDALAKARKTKTPVFLAVGAATCGCKNMQPIVKQVEEDYKGKIIVLFLDVRYQRELSLKLGVSATPTQIFYDKNGKEFYRHIGFYPYEEIKPVLKKMGL
jgi:thioredoxin 1